MSGKLYVDEVDAADFDKEWVFVRAVLYPKDSLFCVGTNKRGYACRTRVKVSGDFCGAHKDQMWS
jgi:hypothetical protein